MRVGANYAVLLTKDLTGTIVDGLGSGAWHRVDARMNLANVSQEAKKKLLSENNFQDMYIGYRLVRGPISNPLEICRYIDKELEESYDKRFSRTAERGVVCWLINGVSGNGSPISPLAAMEACKAMNEKYGSGTHWVKYIRA